MFTPVIDNVMSIYSVATEENIREGLAWYPGAHNFAKSLDVDIERAAGIIAALSPMSGWENNKNKAAQLYRQNGIVCVDGKKNGIGLSGNVTKAQEIYAGAKPLDVLKGNKVRAFYETIVCPESVDPLPVIDRHAFDIAVGQRTDDKSRAILDRKGVYLEFADCYRGAADVAGILPAQMQAITWIKWREIHKLSSR